jgi:hypothetical protein
MFPKYAESGDGRTSRHKSEYRRGEKAERIVRDSNIEDVTSKPVAERIQNVLKELDSISQPETKGDRPWSERENVRSFTGKDKNGNTITGGILAVPDKPSDFVRVGTFNETLNIKFVYSGEGRGGGRMAMEKLIEIADKNGITLSLTEAPFENPLKAGKAGYRPLSSSRLGEFYRSLGFVGADGSSRKDYDPQFGTYMERKPRE